MQSRRNRVRGPLIALATGAVAVSFALLSVRWPANEGERDEEPAAPVVEQRETSLPVRQNPQPLAGNDSSVAAVGSRLLLTGTHVARDPRDSLAFIGVDPKNPQTYALNALLVNGSRVATIANDHVLLERDGQTVRVDIGGAWNESAEPALRLTRIESQDSSTIRQPEPSSEPVTDGLRFSPTFDPQGQLAGYRLSPGRHARVFDRWGLQRGDLLVAIENQPLSDIDLAAQQLQLLGSGLTLRATVIRDGAAIPVVLDGTAIEDERSNSRAAAEALMQQPAT